MSQQHDAPEPPRRWVDDPQTKPALREVLRSEAAPPELSPELLAQVSAGLGLGAATAVTSATAAAGATRVPLAAKLIGGGLLLAGLVAILLTLANPQPRASATPSLPPARSTAATPPSLVATPPTTSASSAEPPTTTETLPTATTVQAITSPTVRRVRAAQPDGADATGREAVLLERARGVLYSDPGEALAITAQHEREFAHGVLTAEREVLAATALDQLGRTDEARERARRLLATRAGSLYARRLQHVLGD